MRSQFLNLRLKGFGAAAQSFKGHSGSYVGCPDQVIRLENQESQTTCHKARAVKQGNGFPDLQLRWLQSCSRQNSLWVLANQGQGNVSLRDQIAAGTQRPLGRDNRDEVSVEHLDQELQRRQSYAGISFPEIQNHVKHDPFDYLRLQWGTYATGVAHD